MTISSKSVYIILRDGAPLSHECTEGGHGDVLACETLQGVCDAFTEFINDDKDRAIAKATLTWETSKHFLPGSDEPDSYREKMAAWNRERDARANTAVSEVTS